MKHSFGYWLLVITVVLVFIFSFVVFYIYRQNNKKNGESVSIKNNTLQDDISILNTDIPTIYTTGNILKYQFVENPETKENALYIQFSTDNKVLLVRVDSISSGGIGINNFIVQELNKKQKEEAIKMLNDALAGLPLVENNYLILSSIKTPNDKYYNQDELIKLFEKNLVENDQNIINNTLFTDYFFSEDKISINLQINYIVPEEMKNSIK